MAKIVTKLCKKCGRLFSPSLGFMLYCDKCRFTVTYYKKKTPMTRVCGACGKKFTTTQPSRKACNDACRAVMNSKKVCFEKVCLDCGKTFKTSTDKRLYCDDKCFLSAKHKRDNARRTDAISGS